MITRDSVKDIWCERTRYIGMGEWSVRIGERTLEEPDIWVQSACVLYSSGCGLNECQQVWLKTHIKKQDTPQSLIVSI